MPYIYKITNLINGKIYVGKTLSTIQHRWKEHCAESKRDKNQNRPLYKAMNKYGIENFTIDLLEEVPESEINNKEQYWIEFLGSFKYGYNATLGGDGKRYANYELIFNLFREGNNALEIKKLTSYDEDTICNALRSYGVTDEERFYRGKKNVRHAIVMLDINSGAELQVFESVKDAYSFLGKQHSGHIADVCKGKRKTAYGYKWRYLT